MIAETAALTYIRTMTHPHDGDRQKARLMRQMRAITNTSPPLQRATDLLMRDQARWIRLPVAAFLILGGIAAILPIFGLWMLPLGLLLLAFDLPILRPRVNSTLIRGRRWGDGLSRRWRARRRRDD